MFFKGTIVITDPCYIKGSHLGKLMSRNTIYGDWSCMVYPGTIEENKSPEEWDAKYYQFWHDYNFSNKTKEEKDEMGNQWKVFKNQWMTDKNIYGQFCADSGMVAVFDYDKLEEKDKERCNELKHCATIIEDFEGELEFVITEYGEGSKRVHVVGTGNKPFFSVQSGF